MSLFKVLGKEEKNVLYNFDINTIKKFKYIYVLVSGGFDSTYLYEIIRKKFPNKTIPTNCYNPYEINPTLKKIKKEDNNFISIKPGKYKDIIKKSFLNLPRAYEQKKKKEYNKKIFPCCSVLKHKEFKKDNRFKEENCVVVSGIKRGDGKQRRIFLTQLKNGSFKSLKNNKPTFFLRHKDSGILYCYPFRDHTRRELPDYIKNKLWMKYIYLEHSGCSLCPILVLFNLVGEGARYERSVSYAKKLGVYPKKVPTMLDIFLKNKIAEI